MDEPLTSPPQEERPSGPWLGLGIGFVVIVAIVGGLIYSSRTSESRNAAQPAVMNSSGKADPYAARLELGGIQLSAADNMLGGTVTYIEGTVTNTGDKI